MDNRPTVGQALGHKEKPKETLSEGFQTGLSGKNIQKNAKGLEAAASEFNSMNVKGFEKLLNKDYPYIKIAKINKKHINLNVNGTFYFIIEVMMTDRDDSGEAYAKGPEKVKFVQSFNVENGKFYRWDFVDAH